MGDAARRCAAPRHCLPDQPVGGGGAGERDDGRSGGERDDGAWYEAADGRADRRPHEAPVRVRAFGSAMGRIRGSAPGPCQPDGNAAADVPRHSRRSPLGDGPAVVSLRSWPRAAPSPDADARAVWRTRQQHPRGEEQDGLGHGTQSGRQPGLHVEHSSEGEPRVPRGEHRQQRRNAGARPIRSRVPGPPS